MYHYIFPGNATDKSTVPDGVEDVKKRFEIKNVIIVGDRGMLRGGDLDMITDKERRFILSPLRRGNNAVWERIRGLFQKVPS